MDDKCPCRTGEKAMTLRSNINYAQLTWKRQHHLKRYKCYVDESGLLCQECGGSGEHIDDTIDFGDNSCGPLTYHLYGTCGWCEGTGKVTRWVRGFWLRCKKQEKKR